MGKLHKLFSVGDSRKTKPQLISPPPRVLSGRRLPCSRASSPRRRPTDAPLLGDVDLVAIAGVDDVAEAAQWSGLGAPKMEVTGDGPLKCLGRMAHGGRCSDMFRRFPDEIRVTWCSPMSSCGHGVAVDDRRAFHRKRAPVGPGVFPIVGLRVFRYLKTPLV